MKTAITLMFLAALPLSVSAADLTGTWKAEFDTQRGLQKYTFTLKQDGTKVTGKASVDTDGEKRESDLKDGKIEGDTVTFVEPLSIQGNDIQVTFTGKISGNEIKFTRAVGDFGSSEATAKLEATSVPIQSASVPPQGFDQVRQGIEKGKLERVDYDATAVAPGLKRWMEVYTPPGYNKDKKYPLLVLLHGIGGNETHEWTGAGRNQGHAAVLLDNMLADKKMVPMIVVFPNGNATTTPDRGGRGPRGGAAASSAAPAAPAAAAPGGSGAAPAASGAAPGARAGRGGRGRGPLTGGWGKAFEDDLMKDIIPFLEAHYSIYTDTEHRALAGLSMGGMQTRQISLANSDKFRYLGVFSGGTISPENITNMDAFKKNVQLVFMSYGSNEGGSANVKSAADGLQQGTGVKSVSYVSPNSAHDFTSWKRSLYYFAPMLFQPQATP